nr:putative HSP20-like chaperone [Tanacetum cinerariifolium]
MSIRHPEIKWAQREDKVYITVVLANTKDAKVSLAPEGVSSFSATAGQYSYDLKLELADKVNVDESKINIDERSIFCILEKAEPKWWNKLLKGDAKTPHYVEVDWDKWVDEDDEAGLAADLDMGGMDFSKFGDMGGFGDLISRVWSRIARYGVPPRGHHSRVNEQVAHQAALHSKQRIGDSVV